MSSNPDISSLLSDASFEATHQQMKESAKLAAEFFRNPDFDVAYKQMKESVKQALKTVQKTDLTASDEIKSALQFLTENNSLQQSLQKSRETLALLLEESDAPDDAPLLDVGSVVSAMEGALPYLEEDQREECNRVVALMKTGKFRKVFEIALNVIVALLTLYSCLQNHESGKVQQEIYKNGQDILAVEQGQLEVKKQPLQAIDALQDSFGVYCMTQEEGSDGTDWCGE